MEIYNFRKIGKTGRIAKRNEITDLKPALRDKERVNVFLNGSFKFSLDITQVVDYKLKVGKVLSDSEIEKLKRASVFGKLYTSTLEWVFVRPRSIRETRDHLRLKLKRRQQTNDTREKNKKYLEERPEMKVRARELKIYTRKVDLFTEEDIESVIEKLIEKKYLDDEKFAKFYVENFRAKKGVSERKLREDLKKKGVSSEIIEKTLENSERNPEEEIKKIILKKKKRYKTKEKLLLYILRQGFDYDLAKKMIEKSFSSYGY